MLHSTNQTLPLNSFHAYTLDLNLEPNSFNKSPLNRKGVQKSLIPGCVLRVEQLNSLSTVRLTTYNISVNDRYLGICHRPPPDYPSPVGSFGLL